MKQFSFFENDVIPGASADYCTKFFLFKASSFVPSLADRVAKCGHPVS